LDRFLSEWGGAANVAKSFGLSSDLNDENRLIGLLNQTEHRLSALVDEGLVTRTKGSRETAIYTAP
jgi:hypothetical protein